MPAARLAGILGLLRRPARPQAPAVAPVEARDPPLAVAPRPGTAGRPAPLTRLRPPSRDEAPAPPGDPAWPQAPARPRDQPDDPQSGDPQSGNPQPGDPQSGDPGQPGFAQPGDRAPADDAARSGSSPFPFREEEADPRRSAFGAALRVCLAPTPALVLACALLLALGVGAAMAWSSGQTVRIHALRLVETWTAAMTEAAPDVAPRLRDGALRAADLAPLRDAGARTDAYGFRLYDRAGAPVASAWRGHGRRPAQEGVSPAPRALADMRPAQPLPERAPSLWRRLAGGERVVQLDAAPPEGGERFARVYLPLRAPGGGLAGYAEVHVDVTAFAARVEGVQTLAGGALAVAGALAFTGPALAWLAARRRREQAEARVRRAARLDALTGLPNRAGFAEAAGRLAHAASRDGARLAVLAIDLDRFRTVNELHGPAVGDNVLRAAAQALGADLRAEDLLARVGPDDFAAVLRLPERADLSTVLARVSARVAAPSVDPEGRPLSLSASVGACLLDPGERGVDEALRRAEIAQREARAGGPGRIRLFAPEMEARVQRRREIETAIREGVIHGRFSLHYQTLVRARDGATRGFEALMRLRDAQGRPISPAEFIPAAEDMDQIGALGAWALHEATSVAAGWPAPLSISVNLSVAQFRDGRLVDTVRSALERSGLAPARLELEITESMLISDSEAVERQLARLRALGVSIAMDDFGAGYSSLAYLWRFRFDRLKLDRSFVLAFDAHPARARGMIGGIVALGRRLGMKVTAEGIETPTQAAAMAELGCDTLQGFHFGRPMPHADLCEVMRWEADAVDERQAEPCPPLSDFAARHDQPGTPAPRPEGVDRRARPAEDSADPGPMRAEGSADPGLTPAEGSADPGPTLNAARA